MPTERIEDLFLKANDFISTAKRAGGVVYVHCAAGVSRSPTLVIAHLILTDRMTLQEAFNLVKSQRSCISPNLGFFEKLVALESTQFGRNSIALSDYKAFILQDAIAESKLPVPTPPLDAIHAVLRRCGNDIQLAYTQLLKEMKARLEHADPRREMF